MKNIDQKKTARLLEALDMDIDIKCAELNEKHKERQLKKMFILSCMAILFIFLVGGYFEVSFVSILFAFFIYQGIILTLMMPLILSLNKETILK